MPMRRSACAPRGAFSTRAAARCGLRRRAMAMPSRSSSLRPTDMRSASRVTTRCAVCVLIAAALVLVAATRAAAQSADDHQDPAPPARPDLVAHVFGSVDWAAAQRAVTPNSFALGQLALFATSSINDRVSVLAEVVMEASAADTQVAVNLERLQLTYRLNDQLNISAGRYHTGIGFYNAAFHHGSYFETVIGRPRVYRFEHEGGVLPIHEVGVSVRGKVPKTDSVVQYVAEVGNGRRWVDFGDSDVFDQNTAKSTNVGVSVRPESWHGAEVGASFYRDDIPFAPDASIGHHIGAVYAIYRTPSTELMAEWLQLSYREAGRSVTYDDHGGYVQASQAFGRLRPYYRYDRLDINPDTPFIGGFGSSTQHVAGLRFDPVAWVGIKSQYERMYENGGAGANGVHVQLVFVF